MKSEAIEYRDGDVTLRGAIYYDETKSGKRPGVLVNPEAFGLGVHAKTKAERLAQLGYVALAADPYGNGAVAKDLPEAMKLATPLFENPDKLRARAHSALKTLAAHPQVDASRLASIGYCMGGTFSLELARDGAALRGIVSFHGGLQTQRPAAAGGVKAKVLVCTGNDDPFVPADQVKGFIEEMTKAGANWELITFGGTVHSFTNPDADSLGMPALKYNKTADERSWKAMTEFFSEIFA
jgi:dienelactone hydrolase